MNTETIDALAALVRSELPAPDAALNEVNVYFAAGAPVAVVSLADSQLDAFLGRLEHGHTWGYVVPQIADDDQAIMLTAAELSPTPLADAEND